MIFDWQFAKNILPELLQVGVPMTLKITFLSFLYAFIIALLMNVVFYFNIKGWKLFCQVYISFFRGTPVILHLYLTYYFLPEIIEKFLGVFHISFNGANMSPVTLSIIGLTLGLAGYLSETIRSSVNKMNFGEVEAALVFGFPIIVISRRVIFPQILRLSIPNLTTQLIQVLQGSSLAFYISVQELTGVARLSAQTNWKYFEAFVISGIIYWVIAIIIERISYIMENQFNLKKRIEKRQAIKEKRA